MKGKKTDLAQVNCGIARALQIVGDWWTLLIVRDAFHGRQRFNEFQKSLGLAKNILSARLKKLVEEGILKVEQDSEVPSSRRYLLTKKGERLGTILVALWQWGEENGFERGELKYAMVDKRGGKPLAKLQIISRDGEVLGPRDFHMVEKGRPGV
ncbi:helix-turn-helix domain-containing protein [soil metagenome]